MNNKQLFREGDTVRLKTLEELQELYDYCDNMKTTCEHLLKFQDKECTVLDVEEIECTGSGKLIFLYTVLVHNMPEEIIISEEYLVLVESWTASVARCIKDTNVTSEDAQSKENWQTPTWTKTADIINYDDRLIFSKSSEHHE